MKPKHGSSMRRLYARLNSWAATLRVFWTGTCNARDRIVLFWLRMMAATPFRHLARGARVSLNEVRGVGGPLWLRVGTTDVKVLKEILRGEYSAVFESRHDEPKVIVDLGANVGLATRLFKTAFCNARVVAVEPEPANASMLECNTAEYGESVKMYQACIGARRRKVCLEQQDGEWTYRMSDKGKDMASVDVMIMDDLIRESSIDQIDILKVDIEGAEAELFAEPAEWMLRVRECIIELHGTISAEQIGSAFASSGRPMRYIRLANGLHRFICDPVTPHSTKLASSTLAGVP